MKPRALNLLRVSLHYRRDAFNEGLVAAGYELVDRVTTPRPGDVVVCWNRYSHFHDQALHFERHGARALIAENGYFGKGWRDGEWFALALDHHAGAGAWPVGGPERWDALGVELAPWRRGGEETLIFGQRGIGESGVRSPEGWAQAAQKRIGGRGRIRAHPGCSPGKPLADDLIGVRQVVTWHSGAALHAVLMGVPVWYDFPQWIGAGAARPLVEWGRGEPLRDDAARLAMLRRLAWAQWTLDEIRTGMPFERLAQQAVHEKVREAA